ncbi:MAG TPA: alpha/beta hydrolase [Roseomonas sp.]|jgi:pimeloyl-ACP methyl ester carboxylesterase
MEVWKVETKPGFVFDVSVAGNPRNPMVLMLHGFGVSRYLYDAQVAALGAAGYFAVAPNQRGYSAGARPDPKNLEQYGIEHTIQDAMDIVRALGHGDRRFHLVGHDWGGSLSWEIADRYADRLGSLSMLSRPHPASFVRAMKDDPEQPKRSSHHKWFLEQDAVPKLLADDVRWLRRRHALNGVPEASVEKHLSVIGNEAAMTAALAWYRARGPSHGVTRPTTMPTLFVWGNNDDTVGRMAAEGTHEFIAAPYTFVELHGVGHYPSDQMPKRVCALLLEHIGQHPA